VSAQTAALIRAIKGTDRLFIIDEADKLNRRSLGALRRLSDNAGVGIVLIGTPELLPMVNDPDGKYGQISSRIGYWVQPVNNIKASDAIAMIKKYTSNSISEDALKAFCIYCEGSARALKNLLRNTYRNALKRAIEVDAGLVEKTHTDTLAGRGIKTVKHGADWLKEVNAIFGDNHG
jgi:DNA transposition AAA+ family ATPase